ncbi:MAG: hypothetical protein AAF721_22300 [Myxococcota bacterium]
MLRVLASLLIPLALAVACNIQDKIDDATNPTGTSADDGMAMGGVCSMEQAAMSCDQTECVFMPADVDCAAACGNIATVCAANDCDEQCTGMESDAAMCMAACEGTKGLACSNLTFGCYADNGTCDAVGMCVDANLE